MYYFKSLLINHEILFKKIFEKHKNTDLNFTKYMKKLFVKINIKDVREAEILFFAI